MSITVHDSFARLIDSDTPVLVDFFAAWCGPCKMMHPVLSDLKERLGDRLRIVKLDIDNPANGDIVRQMDVRSVPTLMLFRNSQLLWRESGAKEVATLQRIIETHM